MELIDFLNANQGAIMAILTFVYVVATVVIVYFNKRSIDEMKEARKEESRPYVFSYLAFVPRETKRCYFVLSNYGKSGARIKHFKIEPEINLIKGPSDCGFFTGTVIAPGQSIKLLVVDQESKMDCSQFSVSVDYEDVTGICAYSEKYDLIQQYAGESGFVSTSRSNASKGENALIDIANSLDTIKTSML